MPAACHQQRKLFCTGETGARGEGKKRAGIKFGGLVPRLPRLSIPAAKRLLLLRARSRGRRERGRREEEARAHVLTSPASSRQRSRSEVSSLPSPDLRACHSFTRASATDPGAVSLTRTWVSFIS